MSHTQCKRRAAAARIGRMSSGYNISTNLLVGNVGVLLYCQYEYTYSFVQQPFKTLHPEGNWLLESRQSCHFPTLCSLPRS